MTYKLCKKLIELGRTAGLADKLDVYFAVGRLTEEEYTDLMGMLNTNMEGYKSSSKDDSMLSGLSLG